MLISKATDETEARGERIREVGREVRGTSPEYQSASVFDLMTRSQRFGNNSDDSLTTQELVLLYDNLDTGMRLMSDVTEVRRRRPNQHVENVVYEEPDTDSDVSEEDHIKINQERLNLFDSGSIDNVLCHKLGALEMQSSNMTAEYNKQFVFNDPYVKEQLQGLDTMASSNGLQGLLPTSLLDFICFKRLEDNYNFYMDNIITYVQHTIDQLKRISNGEYLTDRTKEKWQKVNKMDTSENTQVLATSTSIPLHVECKKSGKVTWDDIVHSEIDVRSLSKILEKKIVLEIPKLISGSYKLFSKQSDNDSLIISCKKGKRERKGEGESRVDVVLKLQRSQTGQVISNINSIMFLQTSPPILDLHSHKILPITLNTHNDVSLIEDSEYNESLHIDCAKAETNEEIADPQIHTKAVIDEVVDEMFRDNGSLINISDIETNRSNIFIDTECCTTASILDVKNTQNVTQSSFSKRDKCDEKSEIFQMCAEASFNLISPDKHRITMQSLNIESSVLEESSEESSLPPTLSKKRSPVRIRIKSPYENKSHILEEKKRKRLLEIRERREKKKMALGENAKVSKHKYNKAGVAPQASVTKLSITNKSFYNSIYGHNIEDNQKTANRPRSFTKDSLSIDVSPIEPIKEYNESPNLTPGKYGKKYINRSYYLDDTETEVMKQNEIRHAIDTDSASPSVVSNEFQNNVSLLSQLIENSVEDINTEHLIDEEHNQCMNNNTYNNKSKDAGSSNEIPHLKEVQTCSTAVIICDIEDNENKLSLDTIECRKSIDKLYNLMRKLGNSSNTDLNKSRNKLNAEYLDVTMVGSTIPDSDGTSLKHHLTSSNPSCISFGKLNSENHQDKDEKTSSVIPKVVITSKLQKSESDKLKKCRKKVNSPVPKAVPENPLKAISQLLLEFDNVQKMRQKVSTEHKLIRKPDVSCNYERDVKARQYLVKRRSRLDKHNFKPNDPDLKTTNTSPRDKRTKPLIPTDVSKTPQHVPIDDKSPKKLADIIDEVKEARGEAVRGPSKPISRLMTLSQPRRSYVQAHSEEYQSKYGKNLMADRLQRLARLPPPGSEPNTRNNSSPISRNKMRREAISSVSVKQPAPLALQIDKTERTRRSVSSSPNRKLRSVNLKIPDAPENLKKTTAKSNGKNKNRQSGSTEPAQLRDEALLVGQMARVPLLPNDIDIYNYSIGSSSTPSSVTQEMNELGKKVHHIIDTVVCSAAVLSPLPEYCETTTYSSTDDNSCQINQENSDHHIDVLEDKNLMTAVENQVNSGKRKVKFIFNQQCSNSATELENLENALYDQLSGAFQNRLRLKNLTLTPKQSLNQAFHPEAGDTKSLIVKSSLTNKSFKDFKSVPTLRSYLNLNLAQIPVQIATIGYAFPLPECKSRSNIKLKALSVSQSSISHLSEEVIRKSDKVSQCFKGVHQETNIGQVTQVDLEDIMLEAFDKTSPIVLELANPDTSETLLDNQDSRDSSINIGTSSTDLSCFQKLSTIEESEVKEVVSTEQIILSELPADLTGPSAEPHTPSLENVDYTTSLDMLVGLLNEIQKITSENPAVTPQSMELVSHVDDLEDDKRCGLLSIASHDKLHLLSSPSIYSYYISSSNDVTEFMRKPTAFFDKEVSVNLYEKEFTNKMTEVPSLLKIVNHGTSVTSSLIEVITKPSQSMVSSYSSHSAKILELPQLSDIKVKEGKQIDHVEKSYMIVPQREIKPGNKRVVKSLSVMQSKNNLRARIEFDAMIKIKRDILVTVYSILVITVFAALSYPDSYDFS